MLEKIKQIISDSIDEFNDSNVADFSLEKSEDEVLFGKNGKLDSLALVSLIVTVEEKVEDELGVSIVIANDKAMSEANSPFRNVKSMTAFVETLLEAKKNE